MSGSPAPGFRLRDQSGRWLSLSHLRGKVVVLEFMDPECRQTCPIVARELVSTVRRLGPRADDVAFVAVNVNQHEASVRSVRRFSRARGLAALPSWHFVTGAAPTLRRVWSDYGVFVGAQHHGDVVHSSLMYFIGRRGRERYLIQPGSRRSSIPASATLMTSLVGELL